MIAIHPVEQGPSATRDISSLAALLRRHPFVVLSGAGVSTESGIPDYRGPSSSKRPRHPISYQEFVSSAAVRRRYWARGLVGWPLMRQAAPNQGHKALARMEAEGLINGIITQNVDGLHQAAGSREVLELHGSLARALCLECHAYESRENLQTRMLRLNPEFGDYVAEIAPDGDAELPEEAIEHFQVPTCLRCGGVLKPDVVFFGENVPAARVEQAYEKLAESFGLLVVGSSLAVFSGYRFVARATEENKPVAIINDGETRGDANATLRLHGRLGEILPRLLEASSKLV
jgi:NAD-dependent SIR2 family protein deacetylase